MQGTELEQPSLQSLSLSLIHEHELTNASEAGADFPAMETSKVDLLAGMKSVVMDDKLPLIEWLDAYVGEYRVLARRTV